MKRCMLFVAALLAAAPSAFGQSSAGSDAQQTLARASAENKYTFLLFYRTNNGPTQAMAQTLKSGLAGRAATAVYVNANSPAEQPLLQRYGVARAPMPLVVAVAPNGAVTGLFASKVSQQQIAGAFVTPTMEKCMKSMQQGRLVMVCVKTSPGADVPQGVRDFRADPHFAKRTEVLSLVADDPTEADFLDQLKIDSRTLRGTTTAFLAPPAVLVGKFGENATKDEMAAALSAAGKCCDDPNCKHNHKGHQASQPTRSTRN
ncbi:MAG: hypothetical protein DWQ37_06500 [Planctomycetota bacterium]|nr:MAG: hypothetical protein DWQ37_06500 [Planctomycetota bacterium]